LADAADLADRPDLAERPERTDEDFDDLDPDEALLATDSASDLLPEPLSLPLPLPLPESLPEDFSSVSSKYYYYLALKQGHHVDIILNVIVY
jgi:hypothetical protein